MLKTYNNYFMNIMPGKCYVEKEKIMMKQKKMASVAFAALLGVVVMGTTAFAGTTMTSYSVPLPAYNGSGYSSTQVKETSGANARAKSTNTGGYNVDVRQEKKDGSASGKWYRNLKGVMDTGYNIDGHVDQVYGSTVRLKFSSDLLTTEDVTVKGSWESQ